MSRGLKEKAEALLAAEQGAVRKARGADIEVALAYPNTYHVGMSNLGVHQLYSILNQRPDTSCERVFLPDEDDIPEYARSGTRLFSLESRRPVRDFDILAFSVSFEQDYLNVLEMLRLAGIAIDKKARGPDDPFLLLGGICSFFNPEPLADIFDAVIIGEGEDAAGEFLDVYAANREKGRHDMLSALCRVPGVYIPEFYEISYDRDGALRERIVLEPGAPAMITKRTTASLSSTIPALNPALSRMPTTRTAETASTMSAAGRLPIAPVATHPPATGSKSMGLAVRTAGRWMPKSSRNESM